MSAWRKSGIYTPAHNPVCDHSLWFSPTSLAIPKGAFPLLVLCSPRSLCVLHWAGGSHSLNKAVTGLAAPAEGQPHWSYRHCFKTTLLKMYKLPRDLCKRNSESVGSWVGPETAFLTSSRRWDWSVHHTLSNEIFRDTSVWFP